MIMFSHFTSGLGNRLIDTENYTRVHERIHIENEENKYRIDQRRRTATFSGFLVRTYRMCAQIL